MGMQGMEEGVVSRQARASTLGHVARLAGVVARFPDVSDRFDSGRLAHREIQMLARSKAFAGPLRRWLTPTIGGDRLSFTADEIEKIATTREGRFMILLVSEPAERFDEAALLIAAAVLQRAVLQANGRVERSRLRTAFGPSAWAVATQEAPVLYASLSALADTDYFQQALAETSDEAELRKRLQLLGGWLIAASASAAGSLGLLVRQRLSPDILKPANRTVGDAARAQMIKLIQRRMPSWSAFIG